jgi:hypothetical protein
MFLGKKIRPLATTPTLLAGAFWPRRLYGWMPHNASFGFLDIARAALGQIHF